MKGSCCRTETEWNFGNARSNMASSFLEIHVSEPAKVHDRNGCFPVSLS
jgi:hypothetical protein